MQLISTKSVGALFDNKGRATVVEVGGVIEIVIVECLYHNILHSSRYIDLPTPYPCTVFLSLHALHTFLADTSHQASY